MKTLGKYFLLLSIFGVVCLIPNLGCTYKPLESMKNAYQKGSKFQEKDRHEEAVKEFEKALERNQNFQEKEWERPYINGRRTSAGSGTILEQEVERTERAMLKLEKEEANTFIGLSVRPALNSSLTEITYAQGVALEAKGLISEAIAKYQSLLTNYRLSFKKSTPPVSYPLDKIALATAKIGQLNIEEEYQLGQKYEADGNLEGAITKYELVLELHPENIITQFEPVLKYHYESRPDALQSISTELEKIRHESKPDYSQAQASLKSVSAELEKIRIAETQAKNKAKVADDRSRPDDTSIHTHSD